jgi:hypothetical protein
LTGFYAISDKIASRLIRQYIANRRIFFERMLSGGLFQDEGSPPTLMDTRSFGSRAIGCGDSICE